ncbi:outer membrane beta-barrel family protein [Flagellimonas meridianipacifica]|uniref:Outer membrane receptor protein involved in Fe transport n=1 Tax=Flagellimonas meridianipacifica TaxID=1080225 RepID=A0A2T0MH36_9FLAO|nr:outer membrane beta-barrel family protein [Allomuricauda pacifica]PRX56875.1 outer membrane receptor protein involved in Fe transport [Allomuricauda pacifica]
MNRSTSVFCIAFLTSILSWGQTYKITGKVVDEDNNSIAFANVLLLRAADSTFVQGTSTDDTGRFILQEVQPNLYLLQASYIGVGSIPRGLDITADVSLGALIIPSSTNLDEVVVTAKRPTVQRLTDRLVFYVENSVVSQGSSWDILRSTPGVIINQEELQIRGQSATVYLNDRKVQLSGQEVRDLLQGFSGANIKSVEVITNPSARYDAEDGPILNIVTSKAITPGYKGSINGSATQAVFPKYSFGTSHYYKTEKLNLFANYSINPKKEIRKTDKGINFINEEDNVFSVWDTEYEQIDTSTPQNANIIVDYELDSRNSLNLTSNLAFNLDQSRENQLENDIFNAQAQLDSTFNTQSDTNLDNTNLAVDLTYEHKLKKQGAKLAFNGHYTFYDGSSFQSLNSSYFDGTGGFIRDFGFNSDATQDIQIFTGQADYSSPLGQGSIEAGLKVSSIDSESQLVFSDFIGFSDTVDESLSDVFVYEENVYAAYFSWVKNWEKWSMKLGVRGELTDASGTSLTLNEINTQDFFEPFPSVYILYSPSENHSFSFDYGRNVVRPKYNDLNPFSFFFNENDFEEGNPRLFPSFSNNFNLNYTLNNEFFFDIYYRDNGENIADLVFQDNTNLTLRELKQNVTGSQSYGLDFTVSKGILPFWFLYAYTSIFHEEETFVAVESGNQEFTAEVDGVYGYLANYITISKDGSFTGEVTMTYLSKFLFGSYIADEQLNLTLGLRKSLFDNRASISLTAEDILEQYIPTYRSRYLNQDNFYRRRPETQFIRFGFTYNFGNFRLNDNQRGIDKKERDRLESE